MWTHGPFRNREKNAYHRFYDLAAEACELLGNADGLKQSRASSTIDSVETERATQLLRAMLNLISRLKEWMLYSDIVRFSGPFRFPDDDSVARYRLDRAKAKGYPTKLPSGRERVSEALYWQRMMYNYWTLRLDLYMTILDNPLLGPLLDTSEDTRALLTADLGAIGAELERAPATLVFEECRKLANNIAVNCTSACDSVSQSFGSLVAVYSLETVLRWYEGHSTGADRMDVELEQHCRAVLDGIRIEESRDPCPFDSSVLPDEVLRRNWC